jgi:hypothetical protein
MVFYVSLAPMKYSEYLPRVNAVSVVVDFDESVDAIKLISLKLPQNLVISATNTYDITLAHPISQLKLGKVSCNDGTLQLTLVTSENRDNGKVFTDQNTDKWSCADLREKTPKLDTNTNLFAFKCGECHNTVVDSTMYKFLDMPSEYWYELMDYWHCHKPQSNTPNDKKYEDLKPPNDTTVLLGVNYLLVNKNTNFVADLDQIKCSKCANVLGDVTTSPRLFKWKLHLCYGETVETFPYERFIYNIIMSKVNSQASRKFKIIHGSTTLYMWMINLGIDISVNDKIEKNTVKLLYHTNESVADENEYETLAIPQNLPGEFISNLELRTSQLPKTLRQVKMGKNQFFVSHLILNE